MYQRFDDAIMKALSSEHSQYGTSEHSIAMVAARRAAAENRVKSLNEATIGNGGFAQMLATASVRFHEDAEAMSHGQPPVNHPVTFYLSTAAAYRKADGESVSQAPRQRKRAAA